MHARLGLERLDDCATHSGHPQRRQRDHRMQKRIGRVKLESAEADWNICGALEAPEQQMRLLHVLSR